MHLWNNAELVALVCPAGVIVLVDGEDSRLEVVCAAEGLGADVVDVCGGAAAFLAGVVVACEGSLA